MHIEVNADQHGAFYVRYNEEVRFFKSLETGEIEAHAFAAGLRAGALAAANAALRVASS